MKIIEHKHMQPSRKKPRSFCN